MLRSSVLPRAAVCPGVGGGGGSLPGTPLQASKHTGQAGLTWSEPRTGRGSCGRDTRNINLPGEGPGTVGRGQEPRALLKPEGWPPAAQALIVPRGTVCTLRAYLGPRSRCPSSHCPRPPGRPRSAVCAAGSACGTPRRPAPLCARSAWPGSGRDRGDTVRDQGPWARMQEERNQETATERDGKPKVSR